MAFKFVLFAALVSIAKAGVIGAPLGAPLTYAASPLAYSAPAHLAKTVVSEEYDPNPQYSYGYDVQDALTGDSKSHVESRSGDVVQGSYSLTDPDGTRRTVDYTADPIHGFNAVVRREPLVGKIATPVAYAAPTNALAYSAPSTHLAYATPVAKLGAPLAYSTSVLH